MKPALWTIGGLLIIAISISDVFSGGEAEPGINISLNAEASDEDDVELEQRLAAAEREIQALWDDLANQYAGGTLDHARLDEILSAHRLEVNFALWQLRSSHRGRWLKRLKEYIAYGSLLALFLLLGPLWLRRRLGSELDARTVWGAIPYYVVTTAAVMVLINTLSGLVIDIYSAQIAFATSGSPGIGTTDALIHYLQYADDQDLRRVLDLLFAARVMANTDPYGALGLVQHLWLGVDAAQHSVLFAETWRILSAAALVLEVYYPLLAVVALAFLYRMIVPVAKDVLAYPAEAATGLTSQTLWGFTKQQIGVLWREFKAMFWLLGFMLVFILLLVLVLRFLSAALVLVSVRTVLATERVLASGGELPELGLFFSLGSLSLFMVVAMALCLASAGSILTHAYRVIRSRYLHARRFRDFPCYWRMVRGLSWGVLGGTVLGVVLSVGLYYGLDGVIEAPELRVWLAFPVMGPGLLLLVWRLRLIPLFIRRFKASHAEIRAAYESS